MNRKMKVVRATTDCTEVTIEKNESIALKNEEYRGRFGTNLGTFLLSGKLMRDLFDEFTKEGVRDLVETRFSETTEGCNAKELATLGLTAESSIRDMMDRIPYYASVVLTLRKETGKEAVEYEVALNRRGLANNDQEEYRVINFVLTAYECGPEE